MGGHALSLPEGLNCTRSLPQLFHLFPSTVLLRPARMALVTVANESTHRQRSTNSANTWIDITIPTIRIHDLNRE